MKLFTAAIAGMALLCSGVAMADGPAGDCPHSVRPPKKRPPPKRPSTPPVPLCSCKGQKGDTGPRGPEGPKGEDGLVEIVHDVNLIEVPAEPSIRASLGAMGFLSDPHGDWAWGPALSLSTQVAEKYDLVFSAGLAAGATDGRESGYMLELTGVRRVRENLGVFAGIYRVSIDGSPDNGNIDGDYLGLTVGIALKGRRARFELGPTVAGLRDDWKPGTQFALGAQASLFVRLGK